MSLGDTAGMFGACAVMITWMTVQYKANLYEEDNEAQEERRKSKGE
jgi:hypothetical protein